MKASAVTTGSSFMPVSATQIASEVTDLYRFVVIVSTIACILCIGGMIYFAIRYRRKSASDKTAYMTHNNILEFLWSFIPFLIFVFLFAWGWKVYHAMRNPPLESLEIHVIGKQWLWEFQYKNGKSTSNELYVPIKTPIRLVMTSTDVLHSFFVPSFRIKQDVIPGKYTSLWFEAEQLGSFQVFCAELCGTAHSSMLAKINVLSTKDYADWIEKSESSLVSLSEKGKELTIKKGCVACHSDDDSIKVGPSFKGVFGKKRELMDNSKILADENYIRESLMNPKAKVAKGFPDGVMPTFQGQISDDELAAIIEYLKGLE